MLFHSAAKLGASNFHYCLLEWFFEESLKKLIFENPVVSSFSVRILVLMVLRSLNLNRR